MTNYSERLDDVLISLSSKQHKQGLAQNIPLSKYEYEAKQAITSLTKELVAEAKPGKYSSGESILNVDGIGEVDGYEGYNQAIDQFEQNLLKALDDV